MAHRNAEAIRWFRDAVQYQPKMPEFWYDLAFAYQQAGNLQDAFADYRKAADLGDARAQYFLGRMYEHGDKQLPKDSAQALYWYRKLADHGDADSLNNVAWEYATSDDPAIRNPITALEYARRAVDLQKEHPNPNYLDTLAEALYINNQADEAVKTELQALALAHPRQGDEFTKRLGKCQLAAKTKN
jgi:TPR repeat protein